MGTYYAGQKKQQIKVARIVSRPNSGTNSFEYAINCVYQDNSERQFGFFSPDRLVNQSQYYRHYTPESKIIYCQLNGGQPPTSTPATSSHATFSRSQNNNHHHGHHGGAVHPTRGGAHPHRR